MTDRADLTRSCLRAILAAIENAEDDLARLDAAAGDGDHGAGMVRGFRAAVEAGEACASDAPGAIVSAAGNAFMGAAGGASGALFGMLLVTVGGKLPDAPDASDVYHAMQAGLDAVCSLGKAKPGDKTMVDTLAPFVAALEAGAREGKPPVDAWLDALPAARAGMEATAEMIGGRGRAARLGERSRGHIDPGAMSTYIILAAVGEVLRGREPAP